MRTRCAAGFVAVVMAAVPAHAFPPYRSTDADVADPWTVEGRLGLLFECSASEGQVEDAAVGLKWVLFRARFSFGTEVLALLPISSEGGAGTQALLLATYREAHE